jgi:hypothetical protein
MGYYVGWIDGNEEKSIKGLKEESDHDLIKALKEKIEALNSKGKSKHSEGEPLSSNKSYIPMLRQMFMAQKTLSSLKDKSIESLEVEEFVNDFCKTDGKLKDVAVTCFDLSDLESDEVRRALIYAVVSFVFEKYKSKELSIEENAYPILFAIEEARTLIPRAMGDPEMDKPATKLARSAVRSIATEGRKMGLGLLVISQTPSSVDNLITSQANTQILHRMTNPDDLTYIKQISESLSQEDLENLKTVGEGTAIVTGVAMKTRTSILVDVRMRYSEEGKQKPTPFKDRLKGLKQLKQNIRAVETNENSSEGMPKPVETGKAVLSNDDSNSPPDGKNLS